MCLSVLRRPLVTRHSPHFLESFVKRGHNYNQHIADSQKINGICRHSLSTLWPLSISKAIRWITKTLSMVNANGSILWSYLCFQKAKFITTTNTKHKTNAYWHNTFPNFWYLYRCPTYTQFHRYNELLPWQQYQRMLSCLLWLGLAQLWIPSLIPLSESEKRAG